MAHQASIIPWQSLANLIEPEFHDHELGCPFESEFVPRRGIHTIVKDEALMKFIKQLAQAVRDQAESERHKYPDTYDEPTRDEVVVSDEDLQTILPSVKRWLRGTPRAPWYKSQKEIESLCSADRGGRSLVPLSKRKMAAFYKRLQRNDCYDFFERNADGFYQVELISSLILQGEMNTVLRIISSPFVDFANWRRNRPCNCAPGNDGWDELHSRALHAYIILNVLYCLPELWEPKANTPVQQEYRNLGAYQGMLQSCLSSDPLTKVPSQLHADFYSIRDGDFGGMYGLSEDKRMEEEAREGPAEKTCSCDGAKGKQARALPYDGCQRAMTTIGKFMNINCKSEVIVPPPSGTVGLARLALEAKGLPLELVENILQFAGFIGTKNYRLRIPHHPMHPANRDKLVEYLDNCWKLVIRTAMALGRSSIWKICAWQPRLGWSNNISSPTPLS